MKMKDALDIIEGRNTGYRIEFGMRSFFDNVYKTDYFPEEGEDWIETEEEALDLLKRFVEKLPGHLSYICVIDSFGIVVCKPDKKVLLKT